MTPVADPIGDGVVDFLDLNSVLGDYGLERPCWRGDVNSDTVVDFLDLNAILGHFGQTCR